MEIKKGRRPNNSIKEKINKMVQEGYSFPEIARFLGLESRQIARYHYVTYGEKVIHNKPINKEMTKEYTNKVKGRRK